MIGHIKGCISEILRGGGGNRREDEPQFRFLHPKPTHSSKTRNRRSFDLQLANQPTQTTLFPHVPHRSAKTANLSWRASIRIILVIIIIVSCPWVCPWITLPCPLSPAFSKPTSLPSAMLMRLARGPHAMCIRPVSYCFQSTDCSHLFVVELLAN